VNTETGEVAQCETIVTEITDANFKKLWVSHILEALDELGGAKLKFLFWLIDAADKQNRIIGSYRMLAEASGVSTPTVARLMGKLLKSDVLRREAQSVHRLNPNVAFAGTNQQRMNVLIRYRNIDNRQADLPLDDAMPLQDRWAGDAAE
jgi:5-methylthioribose kinase